jgi:Tfp pilus assembly protein PilV
VFLLEALVALLVFALATIALLGVLARAARDSGNAQWRTEALDIAASTLALMEVENPAGLAARYDPASNAPGYRELLAAAKRLPGVGESINPPTVTIETGAGDTRRVVITVSWQIPGEMQSHRASVRASIPGS